MNVLKPILLTKSQNKWHHHHYVLVVLLMFVVGCKSDKTPLSENKNEQKKSTELEKVVSPEIDPTAELPQETLSKPSKKVSDEVPAHWREITDDSGMELDIKYADDDNFTKKQIYDCGRCFLRPEAVTAIFKVQKELRDSHGYSLKLFDCFRPQPYQQRLWDAVPNPDYVTPPAKGSMHSRGLAVDLTIVDDDGDELDMGTPFDHLGKEAHIDYKGHQPKVYENRNLLKKVMEKHGFKGIRTEWWHYSFRGKTYALDDWVWPCK